MIAVQKKHAFPRRVISVFLLLGLILAELALFGAFLPAWAADVTYTYEFDLSKGYVYIASGSNASYGYDESGSKITFTHTASNSYLIYQSTTSDQEHHILESLLETTDFKDVVAMGNGWDAAATALGWRSTTNYINVCGNVGAVNMTLRNIWNKTAGTTRGGLNINSDNRVPCNVQANIRLIGDNRFYRVHYSTGVNETSSSGSFTVTNGGTDAAPGTLTVVGNQTKSEVCSSLGSGIYPNNHWDAAIGGDDNYQNSRNMKFTGGIVYAGTTAAENCTAIGGGGNGYGGVTVTGGRIYAVASTTGTALGGGIGHISFGGDCGINISGGEVYAYNFGQPFAETYVNSSGNLTTLPSNLPAYVPGTAIGAGSSINSNGNRKVAEINISGGYVEAYSVAGCAIGAGNSVNSYGGKANVVISGGEIIATSEAGRGQSAGTGIGGGSSAGTASGSRDGGYATVTVSGGNVKTTAIGGGTSKNGNGGDTTVTVSGGTLATGAIGGGFSTKNGYADGLVKITGGSVNSDMAAHVEGKNGELVFLVQIAMYKNNNVLANARLYDINMGGSGDYYGKNDIYTDQNGMIYLWLPEDEVIYSATVQNTETSALERYDATQEADGKIDVKDIGVLEYSGTVEHCYVNIVNMAFYKASTTPTEAGEIHGHVMLEKGEAFQYYLIADRGGYTITPYHAIETEEGKLFQMGHTLTPVDGAPHVYSSAKMTVSTDTNIIFHIIDPNGDSFFAFDLTGGDIVIARGENDTVTVSQAGYALTMPVTDTIHLTTGYNPTSNTVTMDADPDTVVNMHVDRVNLRSDEGVFNVQSGVLNLNFSENNNLISSSEGSPVVIGADGKVVINMDGMDSVRLDGAEGHSAITGEGTLEVVCNGGFLKLNQLQNSTAVPHFSVGTYIYSGTVQPNFTANLYNGEYSFDLIGYIGPDNLLHSKEELNDDNKDVFTARGISRIYTGVTDNVTGISSGNLVLVLQTGDATSIGELTLKCGNVILIEGVHYIGVYSGSNNNTCTLTIYGAAFSGGNITVLAAASGRIPYESRDYAGDYNELAHKIVLLYDADKYVAYFSETPLNASNYKTAGSLSAIQKTNVGTYTVYWYLVAIDGTVLPPDPVVGSNTITIRIATNKWISTLSCTDVAFGSLPKPMSEAKFGEPEYQYYSDRNGTKITMDVSELPEGVYYVRATVAGTDNYTALTSDYIRFRVITVTVFTSNDRNLDIVSGMEHNLQIPGNGAFTVRFVFVSKLGMKLVLQAADGTAKPVPDGTKITFIVIDEGARQYYCYTVSSATSGVLEIPLTDFGLMGDRSQLFREPSESTSVNYQFCIDFPKEAVISESEFSFSLSAVSQSVQITPIKKLGASLGTVTATGGNAGNATVNFTATSNPGAGKTVFAVSSGSAASIFALTDENGTIYPAVMIGSVAFFDLGNQALNARRFTLTATNLAAGSCTLKYDIRAVAADVPLAYALADANAANCKTSQIVVTRAPVALALYAAAAENDTVIGSGTTSMRFTLSGVLENGLAVTDFTGLGITASVKEGTEYTALGAPAFTVAQNVVTVTVPTALRERISADRVYTCRLTFTYGGALYDFDFLLTDMDIG